MVSAIITTHNRKELLKRAIDSVLNQTYEDIECIVVDDNSDDGTVAYISDYIVSQRIKYIYIDRLETKGGNYARNKGIMASVGEYVAFLDDDDVWFPTKIEKQVIVARETGAGFIYCGRVFDNNGFEKINDIHKYPEGDVSTESIVRVITVTSTMLVRKQIMIDAGLFDENLAAWQEYEMALRVLQRTKAALVRENLVVYTLGSGDKNKVSSKLFPWENSVERIEKKHKDLIKGLCYINKKRRLFYKYIDGYSRAKAAGNSIKQLQYARKIIFDPVLLYIALEKKLFKNIKNY